MTFPIPQSLKKYYEERAVFTAVNRLVEVLDGKSVPPLSREETNNYNQALLMAAQVRADFVDLLFRVWDETFGKTEIVGGEVFDSQKEFTINNIWNSAYLEIWYYHGAEDNDWRSNTPGVMVLTDGNRRFICLYVGRFDRNENYEARPACVPSGLEGWKITTEGGDHWRFQNEPVDMVKFLKDPDPTLDRFRREAIKMAEFLASASGHC